MAVSEGFVLTLDAAQVAELLKKGREELEVVKRQAAISKMFKPNMDYVMDKQKSKGTTA